MTPVREALERFAQAIEYGEPKTHMTAMGDRKSRTVTMSFPEEKCDMLIRQLRALSAAPEEPCAVKLLEWKARSSDVLTFDANTPIGHFVAGLTEDDCGMWFIVGQTTSNRVIGGVEAAKAAAQADYEQRIRSALAKPADAGNANAESRFAIIDECSNALGHRPEYLRALLSPAKESEGEGKVDSPTALADKGQPRIHAHGVATVGTIAANMDSIGVSPSEPSPPDDRREIVAQIIHGNDDDWEDLKQAAQSYGPRLKFKNQIAEVYAKADAILAALDGGRHA